MKTTGLARYFYEYVFHQTIEEHKQRTDAPFMVSRARHIRQQLDHALGQRGTTIDSAGGGTFIAALNDVMSQNIEGYTSPFEDESSQAQSYLQKHRELLDMLGMPHIENGVRVPPVVGELGERLPISPYDPRFAGRMNVKKNGSRLSFVTADDVATYANDDPSLIEDAKYPEFQFHGAANDNTWLRPNGPVFGLDDASGLTELSSRMTRAELDAVRPWVEAAARRPDGSFDTSVFMSNDAMYRAAMIMDELRNEGVSYKAMPDRRVGQVKLRIEGTSIDVRVMDVAADESYIGRVYDNGVSSYFMTTESASGSGPRISYTPTAQDCINLVRVAQGKAVQRLDGQGLVGQTGTYVRSNGVTTNTAYRSGNKLSSTYADLRGGPEGAKVLLQHDTEYRTTTPSFLGDPKLAETALMDAVDSARSRFMAELNPAGIIMQSIEYNAAEDKSDLRPEFSMDPLIAGIQQEYWDLLTGRTTNLLRPGADRETFEAQLGDDLRLDNASDRVEYERRLANLSYTGSVSEQLSAHTQEIADNVVGTFAPHEVRDADGVFVERRFDPSMVAKYMASSSGITNNTRMLASAMRRLEISADELMGSDYGRDSMKDRLVSFDEGTAVDMESSDDAFVREMGSHIRESLSINGVSEVSSIRIDAAGVVRYEASRTVKETPGDVRNIVGHLGQIWVPDELGAITTKFAGSENFMYAPGYEATIVPQRPGEDKPMEERTILRGYEQLMRDQISYRIRSDMLEHGSRTEVGTPDSLNRVHRTLYSERHPVDFLERSEENELPREWAEAILRTEARRVRYGTEIGEGSTINADYHARHNPNIDLSDDGSMDPYVLTGGRNMSVLEEVGDHIFDPLMTGQARNQGIVRFLNEGVVVNPDGTVIPGEVGDRTPLMKLEGLSKLSFNPFDRQQMTASNVMKAASIVPGTKTAFTTMRAWNFDDPILVSKKFAQSHTIVGEDGKRRSLINGDKMSDLNGNKGVISRIIDADMSLEEAAEKDLLEEVKFFKANPDMEVVMSPFSAISRLNGGSARELMENPSDLVVNDEVRPGGIGDATFIITHKAADKVTNVYDEEAEGSERGGRRLGAQMVGVLEDAGCDALVSEMMASNDSTIVELREYLNVTGLDIEPDGTIRRGREEHGPDDARRVFSMPDASMFAPKNPGGKPVLVEKKVMAQFAEMTAASGGVLELPWSLNFQTGDPLPNHTDSTFELPVLSVNLRTGQEFRDGRSVVHDYTMRYSRIYLEAAKYVHAKERLESGEELKPAAKALYEDQVYGKANADGIRNGRGTCQIAAQNQFNQLSRDVTSRRLENKHNLVADKVLGRTLPYSATSIITSDPRNGLNEVSMNEAMMKALHINEGDRALIQRAPELHNGAVRAMKVKLDNDIAGIAINPAADLSFEGDFDGDTFGVYSLAPYSEAAREEALRHLSPESNMLNYSVPTEKTLVKGVEGEDYPLYFQTNLDYQVAMHQNPEFKDELLSIQREVNAVEQAHRAGELEGDVMETREELMGELNTLYKDMADTQHGSVSLSFENPQKHMESLIEACVDTGAKGSMNKAMQYAHYLGLEVVDAPFDEALGREKPVFRDTGATLHTRQEDKDVQYATAVKALGAGVSGMFSKRAIKELRNIDIQAVNNVMSKTNQATLQSKHNAAEAYVRFGVTMGPARSLMKGLEITERVDREGNVEWVEARDEKNKPIRATKERWINQCLALHESKAGLNVTVSPVMVERLATAMTNPDGTIRGVEPEEGSSAATMDRLAYGGTFKDWVEVADSREKLFDGLHNAKLAPTKVRHNIEAMREFERELSDSVMAHEPKIKPLVSRDCLARAGEERSVPTFGDSGLSIIARDAMDQKVARDKAAGLGQDVAVTSVERTVVDERTLDDRLAEIKREAQVSYAASFDGPAPF